MGTVNSSQGVHSANNDHNKIIVTNSSRSMVGRQLEKIRSVGQKALICIKNGAHTSYRFIIDNHKVILITAGAALSSAGLVIVGILCAKKVSQQMRSKQQSAQATKAAASAVETLPITIQSAPLKGVEAAKPVQKIHVARANEQLFHAVCVGQLRTVQTILENWVVDVNFIEPRCDASALHAAALNGNVEIAALLLKHGANPNLGNRRQNATPFHLTSLVGNTEVVSLFLENKGDLKAEDYWGFTVIEYFIASDEMLPEVKKQFIKRFEKELKVDFLKEQYASDKKKVAHAWGMHGKFAVEGLKAHQELEGNWIQISSHQLKNAIQSFLSSDELSRHNKQNFFTKEVTETILGAVEKMDLNHSERLRDPQEILDDINKGKPVILPMAWWNPPHAIAIIIHGDFVIRCNRGAYKDSFAITINERRKPVTLEVLRRINDRSNPEYFLFDIMNDLDLKAFASFNIQQKNQHVGNCSWTSPKSAFYALLFMEACHHSSADVRADPHKYAKDAYKAFTSFSRLNQLEQFLKDYPLQTGDETFIRNIKEKALAKLSRGDISSAQRQHFQRALEIINEAEKKRGREFEIRENIKRALANIIEYAKERKYILLVKEYEHLKEQSSLVDQTA